MIGVINIGSGNFGSITNTLDYLSIKYISISKKADLKRVSHIILPGVGAYSNLINKLEINGIKDELINKILINKIPYLGICVGMQILSSFGNENEKKRGLDLLPGSVNKIKTNKILPNIGWHTLEKRKSSILFNEINDEDLSFYFIHSYHFNLKDNIYETTTINYEINITASVEKDNIFGVQFHPEKSNKSGLKMIKNFCNI